MSERGYPDGDAEVVDKGSAPSARVPLSRGRIVSSAIDFIDEEGLAGLTMRKLGERLGVEAMAMYRYVPSREKLLDAVVEQILEQLVDDDEVFTSPQNGWQDFLMRMAHGIRKVALTHPKVFPLVASRPLEAPWLRPPLRSLDWVEHFLNGLLSEGFDRASAAGAYRAFSSFLLGHLLLEVATHGADVGPLDVLEEDHPHDLSQYPTVKSLERELSEDHANIEFEDSLEQLLARMELIRTDRTS